MNLVEIFSSVQGEGPHVGATTIFVRFGECDLRCRWCDSPHTWRPARECRIETARGSGSWRSVRNPVFLDVVAGAAEALDVERHAFVSLTGGEPLLQPRAVAEVARALRPRGPRILLETHGLHADALAEVVDAVDVVSMDWKLGSDVTRAAGGGGPYHREHQHFLREAGRAPEVVVKVVVTPASEDEELRAVWEHVAEVDPATTVVIQPVTPFGRVRERPAAARLLRWVEEAGRTLSDVRLIPQTHPVIGAP